MPAVLSAPLRVLVVEDEPRYRAFLLDVLPDMGCAPAGAATASEAFDRIERDEPDALILDLNLPRVDGMAFLERFRRTRPDTPVIILTGVGDLRSAQQAIRHGVTEFLTKPCHLGQIETALDRARRRVARALDDDRAQPEPREPAEHTPTRSIADLERDAILDALRRHNGNRSAAAEDLGISRRTLYNRLTRYQREGRLPDDL